MNEPTNVDGTQPRPYVIVAGVDMLETGDHALVEAIRIGQERPTTVLHILHVVQGTGGTSSDSYRIAQLNKLLESRPAQLHRYVFSRSQQLGGMPSDVHLHVRLGKVSETLAQFCVDYDADVLVVGTHNRKGLERMIKGSVSDTLVHMARCPVLVARPKDYQGAPRTERPDPPCPDCLRVREETNGLTQWCEFHARPHVRTHVYGYAAAAGNWGGGHDPGIIPS